jgi:hypothetical protein
MLQRPGLHLWRQARGAALHPSRKLLSARQVASMLKYLDFTEPPDRCEDEHLDDLRIDGHVWHEVPEAGYCTTPLGRQWTDAEEQELHRQEEARERLRRENTVEFIVHRNATGRRL